MTTNPEPLSKHKAIRLISTKNLAYSDWLKTRKQGIGSSDAATAVGLNPYKSPLALWIEKTSSDEDLIRLTLEDESSPMHWGKILEPIIAEEYSKKTGFKVRRVNAVLQHPDEDKQWMLANLDYSVVGQDEVQILECKTAGQHGAKLWQDGVPEYYQLQVQHQLAVTGKKAADVCVLICGQDLRIYRIERDEALIEKLIQLESRFWEMVQKRIEPPADGSLSSARALAMLYPKETSDTVDFSENIELEQTFQELKATKQVLEETKQKEASLRQTIQQAMGEHAKAVFADGVITWKRSKDTVSLDTKTLLEAHPELLEQYPLVREGSRRFLVS